jgi:hypothetical protein
VREQAAPGQLCADASARVWWSRSTSLIGEEGLSQHQVAEQAGKSNAWVSAVLRILDLSDDAKGRVGCTQLSVDALTRIARLEDPELQSQLDAPRRDLGADPPGIADRGRCRLRKPNAPFAPGTRRLQRCSRTSRLRGDQLIAALQEAPEEASKI